MTRTALLKIVERYGLCVYSTQVSNKKCYKIFNFRDYKNALAIRKDEVKCMNKHVAEEIIAAYVVERLAAK